MQNKLIITIADEKGSKQFHAHKYIKQIIFWGVVGFLSFVISIFFLMKALMHSIDNIALEQNIAIAEYRYIYQQNESLKNQIQQKNNELHTIHQKIGDLENIIGIQKNNQVFSKLEEVDLQTLSLEDKKMILSLIPNGNPLKEYEEKQRAYPKEKISRKKEALGVDYKIDKQTPVFATSDGVVDTIRTNYKRGYGDFIRLNHAFGFTSLYAHLSQIVVKTGEFVKRGDLIGFSGDSGATKEAVLFYEITFLGKALNTLDYTEWNLEYFDRVLLDNNQIDWKSLIWTIQDIIKLQNYQNIIRE